MLCICMKYFERFSSAVYNPFLMKSTHVILTINTSNTNKVLNDVTQLNYVPCQTT